MEFLKVLCSSATIRELSGFPLKFSAVLHRSVSWSYRGLQALFIRRTIPGNTSKAPKELLTGATMRPWLVRATAGGATAWEIHQKKLWGSVLAENGFEILRRELLNSGIEPSLCSAIILILSLTSRNQVKMVGFQYSLNWRNNDINSKDTKKRRRMFPRKEN